MKLMQLLVSLCTVKEINANKWQNQGFNPGRHALKPMCITTGYHLLFSQCLRKKSSDWSDRTLLIHNGVRVELS